MDTINAEEYKNDLHTKYDAICYNIFLGVATETRGADRICFKGFREENSEHLAVLAVTMACISLLGGRDIAIDNNFISRWCLAKKYKNTANIDKIKKTDTITVNINQFLDNMREWAKGLCGEDFNFGKIYHEYYEERK